MTATAPVSLRRSRSMPATISGSAVSRVPASLPRLAISRSQATRRRCESDLRHLGSVRAEAVSSTTYASNSKQPLRRPRVVSQMGHWNLDCNLTFPAAAKCRFERTERKHMAVRARFRQSCSAKTAPFAGESQSDVLRSLTTVAKAERTVSIELASVPARNPYRR